MENSLGRLRTSLRLARESLGAQSSKWAAISGEQCVYCGNSMHYRIRMPCTVHSSIPGTCRYILVYPQGCDVCNHLSLFLCVADYDKLLPGKTSSFGIMTICFAPHMSDLFWFQSPTCHAGWSHFAQFTIAVVNKDPKKSKYSGVHCIMCLAVDTEACMH